MRQEAIQRRAQILLKEQGIESWPVDVLKIVETLGLNILETQLPDDTSGILEKSENNKGTIFVNKSHPLVRKRFTIAHEIGHYLLSSKNGIYVDKSIFFRDGKSRQAVDKDEMIANCFAAELLMPKNFVKKALTKFINNGFIDSGDDVVQKLAEEFKVSATAMSIKLQSMNFSF